MSDDDLSRANEDDDLVVVNDETAEDSSQVDDGYRLKLDGNQVGLTFIPESFQTGTYSLRSDALDSTPSQIDAQHGSANDAPSVKPSSTNSADIYGISPSSSNDVQGTSNPSPAQTNAKPASGSTRKAKSTIMDDYESSAREYSVEEIYERKRQALAKEEAEKPKRVKRTKLPEHPFWDGLLTPFTSFNTLFRLGLVSAAAFLPLLAATILFTRTLSTQAQEMLQHQQGLGALTAFLGCIWEDKIVFAMICFLWGIFSTPYSLHIFTETASGVDKFEDWPEYSFLGGLGQFLWLAALIAIAGLPGGFIFTLLHLQGIVGFALTATCLTPIFFLSCMQADALFSLITKDVALSLKRLYKSWGEFLGASFAMLFAAIGLTLFALWFAVHNYVTPNVGEKPGLEKVALTAVFLSLLLSFIPALYLRLLGRLAWTIEDDVRKRTNEEDSENAEEEVDKEDEEELKELDQE